MKKAWRYWMIGGPIMILAFLGACRTTTIGEKIAATNFFNGKIIGANIQDVRHPLILAPVKAEEILRIRQCLDSARPSRTEKFVPAFALWFCTGSSLESQKLTILIAASGDGSFQLGDDRPVEFYAPELYPLAKELYSHKSK